MGETVMRFLRVTLRREMGAKRCAAVVMGLRARTGRMTPEEAGASSAATGPTFRSREDAVKEDLCVTQLTLCCTSVILDPGHVFSNQDGAVVRRASGRESPRGKPHGLRERKKLDTRRRIFRAAFELFIEKGFDETTVEEIAERADVGKGTVFNYFPHKTSFLLAAYREWLTKVNEDLGPVDTWTGTARDQLGRLFEFLTELGVQHRPLALQVVFENMRQSHLRMSQENRTGSGTRGEESTGDDDAGKDDEAVRLLEDMTREVIRGGKTRVEIRSDVSEDQAAGLIAAAAFHSLIRGLVKGDPAPTIKAALGAKLDIIFTGLTP
jgi:AcrR family transcriptional regulator